MDLQLKGNVAIVTGSAGGIGRACAQLFAEEGADVVLWDVSPSVHATSREIAQATGARVASAVVDITDEKNVGEEVDAVLRQFGRLDHLVHSAAIGSGKFGFPYTNLASNDWRRVLAVNVMGMTHVAHAVGPVLREQKSGTMIFLASVAGQMGSQTDPPYSASKAANINFAQCLAKDLAPHGVRVNTVCPGMVQTTLNRAVWQAWHDQQPTELRRTYEEWAGDKVRAVVPLGKWQTPRDIAEMAVFLSSPRAAHVTGQTINVDGGFVMHW